MREVELANRRGIAFVDDADYELVAPNNCWATKGHARAWVLLPSRVRMQMYMHVLIMGRRDGYIVDHRNRDGLDNRRENLRWATCGQNQFNRAGRRGSSRFKGVSLDSLTRRWRAQIGVDYGSRYIGLFDDEVVAARAYDRKALELFGEYAYLNFAEADYV